MPIEQAIILGVIQGLSEFLPISSSAHLLLTPYVFGWTDPGLGFDVSLHVGTLAAVLWFFRREWIRLVAAGWRVIVRRRCETVEERRALFLVLATIPGALAGLLLESYAETIFRQPALTATMLILLGVVLWVVDRAAPRDRALGDMRWSDALAIGIAQILAIIPGVSRSGSTMTAGRLLRFDREGAAVFSFLMSMPIIAAAAIVELPGAIGDQGVNGALLAGVLASAVSGWAAISILLRVVTRWGFGVFAAYRIAIGIIVLALLLSRG